MLGSTDNTLLVLQVALVAIICVLVFSAVHHAGASRHNGLALPPGPPERWFVPGPRAPMRYAHMAETYGPVFSFRQGPRLIVIINGYKEVVDIMQKHNAELADRPDFIAADEFVSGGMRTLLVKNGDMLRRLRRALHSQLQPSAAVQHKPIQFRSGMDLIIDVLQDPENHLNHAKRFAASLIMTMTYGKTTPTYYTDPEVKEINIHTTRLGKVVPAGQHIVDNYPTLRHVPFIVSKLRKWHIEELGLFTRMVDEVKTQLRENRAQPSFTTYLLDHQVEYGLSDDELAYLAGSMFGAGSDSTATAISFVIMAAATHPQAQAEVQAQLDTVVGRDRVPTWDDEKLLPLVVAFYLESFRWRPISFGGFAHAATSDIIWNGYVIPKGTTVYGNHWAICRDTSVFSDPDEFKPSRWLNKFGQLRDDISPFTYGFGRRVCIGQHVANNSVFINTALLLWAFNIREDPAAPIDTMNFTDTGTVRALPFKAIFSPRVDKLEEIVESAKA